MASSTSFSNWVSDSSLFSKIVTAAARSRFSLVTIALQLSSSSAAVSYNLPLVNNSGSQSVNLFAVPVTGSTAASLHVISAASFDSTAAARFVSSATALTRWTSDSSCSAKLAASSRSKLDRVQMTLGLYTNTSDFTSKSHMFLALQLLSIAATGLQSVTISGSRFGQVQQSGVARVQLSACQSSTWVSESSIRCRGMSGAGLFIGGYVSVAQVASASVSRVFSYQLHTVASAGVGTLGGGSGDGLKSIAASGGLIVGVLGRGYSSVGSSHSARLRGSGCSQSMWLSDSDLLCRSAWGKDLSSYSKDVVVSVVQQWFGMPNAVSYASVVPMAASVERVPTTGGSVVGVSGRDIGGFGTSARLQLQGTAFESSRWISSSYVYSRLPAIGMLTRISVGIAASVSNSFSNKNSLFSLSDHSLLLIHPLSNAAKSGSSLLTILGRGFGRSGDSPRAYLGVTECRTIWISDSSFKLKTALSSIPFSGVVFLSKNFSAIAKFDAVLSNLRSIDTMFFNFKSSGSNSQYWSETFCNLSQVINSNAFDQVYTLARSIPIQWNASQSDQQTLAQSSISFMDPHSNLSVLHIAAGHAITRATSIISEIAYDETSSQFCGVKVAFIQSAIAEFLTTFIDSGSFFFIPNTHRMCSATPLQRSQTPYQILMCLQPAFIPLFFSSLRTVAPSLSIYQLSAAEKALGINFSAHQVRIHNAYLF